MTLEMTHTSLGDGDDRRAGDDDRWAGDDLAMLSGLSSLLLSDMQFERRLEEIVALVSQAIPTSTAVSVTVTDARGRYRTAAATSALAEAVDRRQYEDGDGPCIAAIETGDVQFVADGTADPRWPQVSRFAAEHGLQALLAVPLVAGDEIVGALNVFGDHAGVLDEAGCEVARRFAGPVAVTLANARAFAQLEVLRGQLESALQGRAVIERAKGLIMAQLGCDDGEAFEHLRRMSQSRNRKLRDIAADVLSRHARRTRT